LIYETFISPTETPNTARELKRALLTFDKVHITDPRDRDLFPPQALSIAMGMPPIFGFDMGPVRPLGKIPGYDNAFDKLMDEIDYARRQDLVDVISSYDLSTSEQATIGAVLLGDYPLNSAFLLWAYRNLGRDMLTLKAALEGDEYLFSLADEDISAMEVASCRADGGINDDPALPALEGSLSREVLRSQFSNIARARLASVIKTVGFCASKRMVPMFGNAAYGAVAAQIARRANDVLDKVSDHDSYWSSRAQMLKVAHAEYIDEGVLDAMSIDDVLKLRTRAWGAQANAREELMTSIADLSKEIGDGEAFFAAARDRISNYRKKAEELEVQRASLGLKIKCDITTAAAGVVSGAAGSVGFLTQLQSAIGVGTTLLAGCIYAADKIKDYAPAVQQLKAAEAEFKYDAAFGLHNFYCSLQSVSKA
jgi:hypothetical protein